MISPLTISAEKPVSPAMDFHELREQGIRYLEKTVGGLWNDYNTHDPGITLLELLCFGITDVAYRTSFADKDLFAAGAEENFKTARQALTCAPVTLNDYRRLILDRFYTEVRNVWMEPATETVYADPKARELSTKSGEGFLPMDLKGIYNIRLQLRDQSMSAVHKGALIKKVRALYHQNRLLCQDLNEVSISKGHEICVCAKVELKPDADIELTHAEILHRIQKFLSPGIKRYALSELVDKGFRAEEIFDGPPMNHGFILEEDLDASTAVKTVRSSDLIAEILKVDGVHALPSLLLDHADSEDKEGDGELWELPIPAGLEPVLSFENAHFCIYKDRLPFRTNIEEVKAQLETLRNRDAASEDHSADMEFPWEFGETKNFTSFTTLQENLPATYHCGSRGTNRDRSPEAMGKARQLKAFLLIFDQMLANYLASLGELDRLFSSDPDLGHSLFASVVEDLPDLQYMLKDMASGNNSEASVSYAYAEILQKGNASTDWQKAQRSKMLDHLLARFGEVFADHVLMHYTSEGRRSSAELNAYKGTFLSEIDQISSRRGHGHDYTDQNEIWNTKNVAGCKHRIERLLGFPTFSRRSLSKVTLDLYEEEDTDDKSEIRFRIVRRSVKPHKVLLSGTEKFLDRTQAFAKYQRAIALGMNLANYSIKQAKDGRWYIVIVDKTQAPEDIVAMRKEFFKTHEKALEVRNELAELIAEEFSEEGAFFLEHILFRPTAEGDPLLPAPCDAKSSNPSSWDPYSNQIHIILPGWGLRLGEPTFRQFVEQIIRREMPAHLLPRVCFISKDHMRLFEGCYLDWLRAKANEQKNLPEKLRKLFGCLELIHTIYPPGTLHDFIEDGDEENPVILGRTSLGSL